MFRGCLRFLLMGLVFAIALSPMARAESDEPQRLFWEWSGKLQWTEAQQLHAGDRVHIALVDADCAGVELAHFDALIPPDRRTLPFVMLGPTRGHDGHHVTLIATFRDSDLRRLNAEGDFTDFRRRLR